MASSIEWTQDTANPVIACTDAGEECANCYAKFLAWRFQHNGGPYEGLNLVRRDAATGELKWTGNIIFKPHVLDQLRAKKQGRLIFMASMGDVFHQKLAYTDIEQIFNTIRATPQHTYQLLTKRTPNAARFIQWYCDKHGIADDQFANVFPNLWLGVSAGTQKIADARLAVLTSIPQNIVVRFLSAEPLLARVKIGKYLATGRLNWVITGGESGANARRLNWDDARSLRDQCAEHGVPFFFKQEGTPAGQFRGHGTDLLDGVAYKAFPPQAARHFTAKGS